MDKYIIETKRAFLILVLLWVPNLLSSQDYFIKENFNWEDWETKYSKEEKIKLTDGFNSEFLEELGIIDLKFISDNIDNFHFLDFDADGQLDIVYNGFAGAESDKTILFINKKGNYKKILSVFGSIINMKRDATYLPVSFQLIDYPCCENVVHSLKTYYPTIADNNFKFKLVSNINYIENTEFPKQFINKPIPFEVINEAYKLRKTPKIDDNNMVSTYKKGSLGVCLATKEVEDRVWWFVIMHNNIDTIDTNLHEGNNEGKYYSAGWMSSRFLEKTN